MALGSAVRRRSPARWLVIPIVLVLGLAVLARLEWLPSISNPFRSDDVDRSQPSVLHAIEDLSEYKGATGNFSVVVDSEEDTRFLPDFLSGERTLFVAAGNVDAVVDFASLGDKGVVVSDDRKSVTITLPSARLTKPLIDPQRSRVVSRDRGILDRLGGVFSDPGDNNAVYKLAEQKLATAAVDSDLRLRAEENTRAMLTTLLTELGFEKVTVVFQTPPA